MVAPSQEHKPQAFMDRLQSIPTIASVILINTFVISLGQLSEAIELVSNGSDYIRSQFSNSVEYTMLEKVHVGNTVAYIENEFGTAQVSRAIDKQTTANYFYDHKFLLTLFYSEERVVAYTYLALVEGFSPVVSEDSELSLGLFNYDNYAQDEQSYVVDHSSTVSFYLEVIENGRHNLFANSYVGQLSYGTGTLSPLINKLYEQDVYGDESVSGTTQGALRQQAIPNLYGEGILPLQAIEKSVLSNAEFRRYFL